MQALYCNLCQSYVTLVSDATDDHALGGVLFYLTFTRPVGQMSNWRVCIYMHDVWASSRSHQQADTLVCLWLHLILSCNFYSSSGCTLVFYSNVDCDGCPDTRCSTSMAMHCFWVLIWSLGLLSASSWSHVPVLRWNTVLLTMLSLSCLGCGNYMMSFIVPLRGPQLPTITMLVWFISWAMVQH